MPKGWTEICERGEPPYQYEGCDDREIECACACHKPIDYPILTTVSERLQGHAYPPTQMGHWYPLEVIRFYRGEMARLAPTDRSTGAPDG